MMGAMLNAMRLQAQRAMADQADTRVGLIRSFDPNTWSVRVELQPEAFLTGWLPLSSPWIGNAWGMFAAPSLGDMVAVHFFGGELEAGFVEGRLFNDTDRALPVPASEFWLVHKSGSFLKFTNDGNVSVHSAADLVATVGGNLTATVGGNATASVSGNITATAGGTLHMTAAAAIIDAPTTINGNTTINGITTLNGPITQGTGTGGTTATLIGPLNVTNNVTAQGTSLHTHVHTGVSTGPGNTGAPA